jgi:hypothetical protein
MDSVAAITPAPPALAYLLSSSSVKSALQQAPSSDVVKLSPQALQLQVADGPFGNENTPRSNTNSALASLLAQISPPIPVSAASRPVAAADALSASVARQLGIFQGQLQAEDSQPLFGPASGTSVNLLG